MQDRNTWDAARADRMGCAGHTGYGHYHERYRRCPDGGWRIAESRLSYLHMDVHPLVAGATRASIRRRPLPARP